MGIGAVKEGFSVYGLLNRCGTPMGKALLRQWCLAPVADLAVLRDRHDTIDALMAAPDLAASVAEMLRKVRCGS
jgi:DNA mismatch repair protein MSH5